MSNPTRVIATIALLVCLVVLLLMPGAITAMVVRSHSSGKQIIRVLSLLTLVMMAAVICCGLLHLNARYFSRYRQVFLHGYGPNLLDLTCARLC
jgi:ABC-type Fe3+ transport system permease subunit